MIVNYDEPPIGEHRKIESFEEDGGRFLECKRCGALWSLGSESQVAEGDGSCLEEWASEEAAIAWGGP